MTAALIAAAIAAGLVVGLRINARRLATLRELLRDANKLHSAYITSAHNEDLAEVGPVTPPRGVVELFDGARLAEWREWAEPRPWPYHQHVSRSFGPDRFAPGCGCPLAPCGLVEPQDGCPEHGHGAMKTIREAHEAVACPALLGEAVSD